MSDFKLLVLGGGKIGRTIAGLLHDCDDYAISVGDQDAAAVAALAERGFAGVQVDVADPRALAAAVSGNDAVISACPYDLTPAIATAARDAGAHYFDLTEDVESTRAVKRLAEGAETVFMPQCGLAPGFVSIVAADLAHRFDELHDLRMRVGALPKFPSNALKYNLTWSTDGLINEYCNPCEAIVEGVRREVAALEGREEFALDGIDYEAFNTSGGLGTLCETLEGRVRNLNYKTVRYPGHLSIMRLLIDDLKLRHSRRLLKDMLESAIPVTTQDVVLVFVTASGLRDGILSQESFATKIYDGRIDGACWSAIQITTAAAVCAAVDLVRQGALPQAGFVRQEDIGLKDFLANRFGRHYAAGAQLSTVAA